MPSFFYKDTEEKTWKSSVKKAILVTPTIYQIPFTNVFLN